MLGIAEPDAASRMQTRESSGWFLGSPDARTPVSRGEGTSFYSAVPVRTSG
jgi:hypothetical protein